MYPFSADVIVFGWLNSRAGQHPFLDLLILEIANNHMFKGVVVAMALVAIWAWRGGDRNRKRAGVLATVVIGLVAIFIGRALATLLPFSPRPIHSPEAAVNLPTGVARGTLDGWSSLPSDHAVMFFALAVSVLLTVRWLGLLLLFHALVVVSLPRIYLGFHWPSDIALGIMVGSVTALTLHPPLVRLLDRHGIVDVAQRHAVLAFPVLFFLLLQVSVMFEPLREFASRARHLVAIALWGA
jgi:undecaprenyl-diphosphatase